MQPLAFEVYGLRFGCDFALPELQGNECPGPPTLHVRRAHDARPDGQELRSTAIPGPNDEPFLELITLAEGYRLHFQDLATFDIRQAGREVTYRPHGALPRESLAHLLLDHVLPRIAHLGGALCLHATAVATTSGVHAFMAPTGRGKSTLIAALMQHDCAFVADDCLALREQDGHFTVSPGYPGVRLYSDSQDRLWPDSRGTRVAHYSSKQRVLTAQMGSQRLTRSAPLQSVYLLERSDAVHEGSFTIAPLAEVQAATCLMANSFRMDPHDPQALRRDLRSIASIVNSVPLRGLSLSGTLGALHGDCAHIVASFGTLRPALFAPSYSFA